MAKCECKFEDVYDIKQDVYKIVTRKISWLKFDMFEDYYQDALVKVLRVFDRGRACLKTYLVNEVVWLVLEEYQVYKRRCGIYVDKEDILPYDCDYKSVQRFVDKAIS